MTRENKDLGMINLGKKPFLDASQKPKIITPIPWLLMLGVIVGIIGLIVCIYFYNNRIRTKHQRDTPSVLNIIGLEGFRNRFLDEDDKGANKPDPIILAVL